MEKEDPASSISRTLNILCSGLYSSHIDVQLWTLKVLTKLAIELDALELSGFTYEWFVEPDGGLESTLFCFEKNSDTISSIVTLMTTYGRYNLMELFTLHLSNFYPEKPKYLDFVIEFYGSACESVVVKESLIESGVLESWIEQSLSIADESQSIDEQITALCLLTEVWATKSD